MRRKILQLMLAIFVVVALLVVVGSFWGYATFKSSLPVLEGEVQIPLLKESVTVYRDSMGIPQVVARSETDAYFALGYLHAADRLFQIDLTRRVATGRLSELLGPSTLFIDRYQRMLGHYRLAKKFVAQLDSQDRERLQAYLKGIAYWVKHTDALPFEYLLLRKEFKPYTMEELLSVLSFQTWFANYLQSSDTWFLQIAERLGREKAKDFEKPYPLWAPFTVPQQNQFSLQTWLFKQYFSEDLLPYHMAHSSNSWVVAPQKSASGFAMLASDPHLETRRLPQFWYLCGLHVNAANLHVLGISTPGLPFTIMGHNGKAAWAFTVGGIDVSEIYQEKRHPQDSTLYFNGREWYRCQTMVDTIYISGEDEPYILRYKQTENGPVIWTADSMKADYALHWAGFDVNLAKSVQAAFRLAKLDNFEDFRRAVTSFGALDANWTYADIRGNIGYQLGTPIPIRPFKSTKLPVPGWIDSLKWQGFQPLEKTPHSLNPQRGWLATCNNKQDDANLDYPLMGKFAADRILRISELLSQNRKFGVQDMQNFQMDRVDRYHQRWQKILLGVLRQNGRYALADRLKKWDGSMESDSREAALVMLFLQNLKKYMLEDELGEQLKFLFDDRFEQIYLQGPDDYFDDLRTKDKIESREEITNRALQTTLEQWQDRPWGEFLTLTMAHPFARVPLLSNVLNLKYGPIPWGGSEATLNASFFWEDKQNPGHFKAIVGPSWRFVIDFSDPDQASFVLPAGISGNPLSPYFFNFFEYWKSGKRWIVPISPEKIKQRAKLTLKLTPMTDRE
ncbi:penicillin acylase family protein [Caldithrix abyssi]